MLQQLATHSLRVLTMRNYTMSLERLSADLQFPRYCTSILPQKQLLTLIFGNLTYIHNCIWSGIYKCMHGGPPRVVWWYASPGKLWISDLLRLFLLQSFVCMHVCGIKQSMGDFSTDQKLLFVGYKLYANSVRVKSCHVGYRIANTFPPNVSPGGH